MLTVFTQREIEKACPQILGEDAELWQEFIKRDIEKWEEKIQEPKNPHSWYKVYRKLRVENDKAIDQDIEILKKAMEGIKKEQAKHTSKVIDPKMVPKLPRMGGMRVERGLTGPSSRSSGNTSVLSFASGSRTKTLTGAGVIAKARREAKQLSLFSAKKSTLSTPTHQLSGKATQIRYIPKGLVEELRRNPVTTNPKPDPKPVPFVVPRKRNASGQVMAPPVISIEERERRLKALTAAPAAPTAPAAPASTKQTGLPPPQIKHKPLRVGPAQGSGSTRSRSPSGVIGTPPSSRPNKEVNPFMPPAKRRRV